MESNSYSPNEEEVNVAEESMTGEQFSPTEKRLNSYGLATTNFVLGKEVNLDEIKIQVSKRVGGLDTEKLYELRKFLTPYANDFTRASQSTTNLNITNFSPVWAVMVGESIEDELIKRGLARRGL